MSWLAIILTLISVLFGLLLRRHLWSQKMKRDLGTDLEPEQEIAKIINDAKKAKNESMLRDLQDSTKVAELVRFNLENQMAQHRKKPSNCS
jgi:hypothetical protein